MTTSATSTRTVSTDGAIEDCGLCLVVLWSRDEPERVGEIARIGEPDTTSERILGRGGKGGAPIVFARQRPGRWDETGSLASPKISRRQLALIPLAGQRASVTNVGRGVLLINEKVVEQATIEPGDLVEIDRRLLLLATSRPRCMPALRLHESLTRFEFGRPDGFGIVGESPAAWALRSHIQFLARRDHHVLIAGPSGTGKELVAGALHGLSARAHNRLVARNAATIPDTLIDAELFGNVKDYPNPGMRERGGLIGDAHGSTLFLDEIGELSHQLQAHLLRVMDLGEYQRLGESRTRTSDLRLIAATNRPLDALKHDFLARFSLRLTTTGLEQRPEDIPLLVNHVVGKIVNEDPELLAALRLATSSALDQLRPSCALVKMLVRRSYLGHVRELTALLWNSIAEFRPPYLRVPHSEASWSTSKPNRVAEREPATSRAQSLSRADVIEALEAAGWVVEKAWPALGLRNRHQLRRLMARLEIVIAPRGPAPSEFTREQLIAALKQCGGVKERAWRALGLRNRHQLARLLRRHEIES